MTAPSDRWTQRWERLPREARDTLFQLAVIAWTAGPHFTHLPPWCTGLTLLLLAWRARIALTHSALPRRAWVVALLALATGLTLWSERTLLGKDAGVTLLVMLLALKTLEQRARRDALVVFFLGFFLTLTHCLYSQSMFTALSMLVSTWGLLTAQVLSSMPVGLPSLRRAGGTAARVALLGVPLMVLLFVLFPRFGPLWGLPQDGLGHTGLSGALRMGGVAELASDEAIAFRVRFEGREPPPQALYFRGPVLTRFDGFEWRQPPPRLSTKGDELGLVQRSGTPVRYEMMLEPIRLPLLPLLEFTPDLPLWPGDSADALLPTLSQELVWRTDRLVTDRQRLSAQAWPMPPPGSTLTADSRPGDAGSRVGVGPWMARSIDDSLRRLPPERNPRAVAWAHSLRASPELRQADASRLAAALLAHIRTADFSYTLTPGTYGLDAVDEFWLDRRVGFCEHYAASFVVLMRAMGVPARIVTGYQGAEPPDADGWRIVRQSNAHAWAEYWEPRTGWIRVDPTAAVAPERIDVGAALRLRGGFVANTLGNMNPALAERLRRAWELLDSRWAQWVTNYSRSRQLDLLSSLGVQTPSMQDIAIALISALSALAVAGALWAWWDRRRQDPWARLHGHVCRALQALDVPAHTHQGPATQAAAVLRRHGEAGRDIASTLHELEALRYGPANRHLPERDWKRRFDAATRPLRRVRGALNAAQHR
jgi:transglutaminase-like putative cysteine protease